MLTFNQYDFSEKSRVLDKTFSDYLKGRSVAIVGRGGLEYMEGMEQGEYIDSHDVVIRIHDPRPYSCEQREYFEKHNLGAYPYDPYGGVPPWGMSMKPVPEEWHSRVGKRCDVMYFHRGRIKESWWRKLPEHESDESLELFLQNMTKEYQSFRRNGGKFLCAESWLNHQYDTEMFWQDVGVRYLTQDHWLNTMRAIGGSRPFAGTLVTTDVLRHEVERVFITGMSKYGTAGEFAEESERGGLQPENDLRYLLGLARAHPHRVAIDKNMHRQCREAGI